MRKRLSAAGIASNWATPSLVSDVSTLARALHIPANRITALINGQRGFTADTALRLAHYFGTTLEFRVRLQAEYDLRQARRTVAEEIKRDFSPRVANPTAY